MSGRSEPSDRTPLIEERANAWATHFPIEERANGPLDFERLDFRPKIRPSAAETRLGRYVN